MDLSSYKWDEVLFSKKGGWKEKEWNGGEEGGGEGVGSGRGGEGEMKGEEMYRSAHGS